MTLVLDASFCLAWIFARERTEQAELADRVLQRRGQEMWVVPSLWPLEVANALLVAERRGVIQPELSDAFLRRLAALRIAMDPDTIDLTQPRLLTLARQHQLSAYDASYLELALRRDARLASFDRRLQQAAEAVGCGLEGGPAAQAGDGPSG
jgi:predicted nucleic acid-binding protein